MKRCRSWHEIAVVGRYKNGHCSACMRERASRYHVTLKSKFSLLKYNAKKRSTPMDLTFEQYTPLALMPCDYCGGPLPPVGSGVDRKNNALGYTQENSVSCCGGCNETKSDKLSYDEMKLLIRYRKSKQDGTLQFQQ